MASTMEVGQRLVELCKVNRNVDAVNTLYAQDVLSIEAAGHPGMPQRQQGIDAIRGKNQWWIDNHTVNSTTIAGPFPHGERFIILYKTDVTPKAGPKAGQRMQVEEAGLYTVRDGKVVQEEFFYNMG